MRYKKSFIIAVLLLIVLPNLTFADDIAGNWCRKEGGKVIDVLKISKVSSGYRVTFHEGLSAPKYAEAYGQFSQGTLYLSALTALNVKNKETIFISATINSGNMAYRSWNLDGSSRFQGSYSRCVQ